jgi:hypothetical protein
VGHFATNSPRYASKYAVPAYNGQPGGPTVHRVFSSTDYANRDQSFIDDIEAVNEVDIAARLIADVQDEGRTGIRIGPALYEGTRPIYEYAIFDPRNIRSQFARFDPRLAHLANLSAGIGGVAVGLNALAPTQENADRQVILDWLNSEGL